MELIQMLMGATSDGGGAYSPNAVKFDGANDYLTRGADLTGIADSKSGILSFWLRLDNAPNSTSIIRSDATAGRFACILGGSIGQLRVVGYNAAGTMILNIPVTTANNVLASANWLHCLFSWDLAVGATHLYVDDVDSRGTPTATNDTIDYVSATPNWAVGGSTAGTLLLGGCLSELYFAPGQYLDFSNSSNRRKFIDASGLPVDLGATGATPTGTAPIIYLKGNNTAFGVNSGTGGNFTVNGILEKASTTPVTLPAFNAVDFDGSVDYLTRGGDLTGLVDGKSGLLSCWLRYDADTSNWLILANGVFVPRFYLAQDGQIRASNTAGVSILNMYPATAITTTGSGKWFHVLASWDLATTTTHLYINGVSNKSVPTATNDTIDYTSTIPNWAIGAGTDGANKLNGAISELYFAPNQYLDLSVQANREKFILNGAPVSLGATGSLPTGTAPAIYLPNRAALIGTNAGTGGNFTINGAPKDANSTPVYYYAEPVKFDGANDYLTRGGDLTGIADGKAGTVSFWIRADGADATSQRILVNLNSTKFVLFRTTANKYRVIGVNAAGSNILVMETSTAYAISPVWIHVLMSWDLATTTTHCYVNNVSDKTTTTATNDTIDYVTATPNWVVGANTDGTTKLFATIADLWFHTTYLDISQASNRAKFIDQTTLRPVALGAKGELVTGSQPLLYLGRDFSNFQTNLGSGGAFTVTGALTRGTTSPSDVKA